MADADAICESGQATSGLSAGQDAALVALTIVSGALSVVGSAFILSTYALWPELRSAAYKRIAFLSVTDLVASANYVLGAATDPGSSGCVTGLCYFNAAVGQYFEVASFFWTAALGHHLVRALVKRRADSVDQWYHAVCWGAPVVLLVPAMGADAFGDAGSWCWIASDQPTLRVLLYYGPMIAVFLYNAHCYARVHAALASGQTALASRVDERMRLYLLVFVGCNVFALVNRVQNWVAGSGNEVFALYALHSLFAPLQGAGNAVVYGLNQRVRAAYSAWWCGAAGPEEAGVVGMTAKSLGLGPG